MILVEYDRTRRVDKNYDKFRRYDAFICWWWRNSPYRAQPSPPLVLFVCQTPHQRQQFLTAAGPRAHGTPLAPERGPEHHDYVGRRQLLFALEHDAHAGVLEAWQLPRFPPAHPARDRTVHRVPLRD